jgi:hypothetical protein
LVELGRILNLEDLDSLEELRQIVVEYKKTSGFDPSWPFPHIVIDIRFRLVNLEVVVTEAETVDLLKAATR